VSTSETRPPGRSTRVIEARTPAIGWRRQRLHPPGDR
jgi:hypothetical protein